MRNRWLQGVAFGSCVLLLGVRWETARGATLNTGTVSAQADAQTPSTATFSTTPFVTAVTSTADDASSTTTPDATGLIFKGSFSQSADLTVAPFVQSATPATAAALASASGSFVINFAANSGDTYSLFGGETPTEGTGTLSVSLYNNTTNTSVYSFSGSGDSVITADGTGGSTASTLSAGNYTFTLMSSLVGDVVTSNIIGATPDLVAPATLTGSGGITLVSTAVVLPEPTAPILLIIGGGLLFLNRRRRTQRA